MKEKKKERKEPPLFFQAQFVCNEGSDYLGKKNSSFLNV